MRSNRFVLIAALILLGSRAYATTRVSSRCRACCVTAAASFSP